MDKVNLSKKNKDFAIFLPSISGFYNTFISKQRQEKYVPKDRIPAGFEEGVEGCNFLNMDKGYYTYNHALYSAGHAQLDIAKSDVQESMVQKRDKENTWILGDSGGFQIGKGVINFDWQRFWEQKGDKGYVGSADKTRLAILNWLEHTADHSMILDIPAWAAAPVNRERTGLTSFNDCLKGTLFNNDFFLKNRKHETKFLNVLQGGNNAEADIWYNAVKHYEFEGWAMGGNNMRDIDLAIRRLIVLRDEGLLESGRDVVHFLGTSKLEWAVILTAIQRKLREQRGDVCWYKPGMLNKLGKEGKTSWDSFSYFLYMAHNVYQHIESVQRANELTDAASVQHKPDPREWRKTKNKSAEDQFDTWVPRNVLYMVELINQVFDSEKPMELMDKAEGLLANFNEKKTLKTTASAFDNLFEVEDKGFANEAETFDGIAADEDRAMDTDLQALEKEIA